MMLPQCRCTSARTASTAWRRRLPPSSHRTALRSGTLAAAALALGVSTASVGRPTRLLRQSTTTTTATASPAAAGSTAPAEVSAPPPAASTMSCYDTFLFSQDDLHLRLLQEAHRKHGVWLTVPPQLAPTVPNVGPPAIPEPMYPPKQRERFEALERGAAEARRARGSRPSTYAPTDVLADPNCLAYTPTHLPPPFITTGTHNFRMTGGDVADVHVAGADATQSATGAVAVHATASAVMMEVAVRAPVDASMLFHCSACGRAFRRREAAEAHVRQRHDNTGKSADAAARVVEGGGPGEITGYKTVLGSPSHPTGASRASISSAANQPRGVVCTDAAAAKSAKEASTATAAAATAPAVETSAPAADAAEYAAMPLPPPAALLRKRGESLASAAYRAAPAVHLPEEHLVDELLASVWDDVALHREDIEKAGKSSISPSAAGEAVPATAVDSCNGRFFIPSSSFVEGKADNRAELEAELAGKTLARATPAGAAPGIKRRTVNVTPATVAARRLMVARLGEDGNVDAAAAVASAAPTAQELSITELSRHYPNPFGDSPNAALIEQEKEPANPFRDLEAEGEKEKGEGEVGTAAADSTATPEQRWSTWQQRFAARPYACPLCQRQELPQLVTLLTGSSAAGAGAGAAAASASLPPSSSPAAPCTASPADEAAWRQYEARVPRFRLLDSLDNHIESCHAEGNTGSSSGEVTEEEWQRLYAVEASPTDAAARELRAVQLAVRVKEGSANTNGIATAAARRAAASSSAATSEKSSSASSAIASDATATEDGGESSTEKADEDAAATTADGARDALAGAEAPHVHVRAAVNTVLVGEVRDVQEGFVGSMRVLQYVVAVHNGSPCSASEGGEEKEEEVVADEDLIVVRCMGDLVPVALLHQRVQLGSTLFVAGSLRMNRSIDTASRRSHAYPYVQVVPPLGSVRVVK